MRTFPVFARLPSKFIDPSEVEKECVVMEEELDELYELDEMVEGLLAAVARRFDLREEPGGRASIRGPLKNVLGRLGAPREAVDEVKRRLDEIAPGLSAELDMIGL